MASSADFKLCAGAERISYGAPPTSSICSTEENGINIRSLFVCSSTRETSSASATIPMIFVGIAARKVTVTCWPIQCLIRRLLITLLRSGDRFDLRSWLMWIRGSWRHSAPNLCILARPGTTVALQMLALPLRLHGFSLRRLRSPRGRDKTRGALAPWTHRSNAPSHQNHQPQRFAR